tara:strand:+ start:376 stop:576 length:201 start_codon:yes stop_codon:yes gene_type:complete
MKKYKNYIIYIVIAVVLYFLYQRYMVAKNVADKNDLEQGQQTGGIRPIVTEDKFGDPVSYASLPTR